MTNFSTINEALAELKKGKLIIVVDKPDRENQGDLILAAQFATAEKISFMLNHGKGMICAPITEKKAAELELSLMIPAVENTEETKVNFTLTVDAKLVTSFGISAADRALTLTTLADPKTASGDFVKPGHVFPLLSSAGGILEREGHTEATIELLELAGLNPVGVLCEILKDNGAVASLTQLLDFAKKFDLKIISIADLINYVKESSAVKKGNCSAVNKKASSKLPTKYGKFEIIVYHSIYETSEHVVLRMDKGRRETPLVRLHSKCLTGDTFFSLKCDCGEQLQESMQRIGKEGGLILYLNQEGRGIGLANKISAYALQDQGEDTIDANLHLGFPIDARDYRVASDMLKNLGVTKINLLSNNPQKKFDLEKFGISVEKMVPIEIAPNKEDLHYLQVKKQKLGHLLTKV